jgi:spore coat-associated protein N
MTRAPRRMLAAIGALLLAAALAVGSGANFQSTSANAGNLIKAGVVAITSTSNGAALLNVTGLAPGHSSSANVDITNSGDLSAAYTLTAANLVDTPSSPAFSAKADLKIEDLGDPSCSSSCPATVTVYNGKLGSFTSASLGTFAVNAKHRFKFTVSLADGGLGAEDAYQGASSTVDFTWTAA